MWTGLRKSSNPSKPPAIKWSTLDVAPIQDSMVVLLDAAQVVGGSMWSWCCIVESHSI